MYILISMIILLVIPLQIFGVTTHAQQIIKSRTVTAVSRSNTVKSDNLKMRSIVENQEEYVLVPKRLIGNKLARYFTETSASVIAMSCCPQVQVHRRCLRDMFHAKEHRCSDKCPGCCKQVTQHVFAQSRSNYILANGRKNICDYCRTSLKN